MPDSLSKDTAPRHTFLWSNLQCWPPRDPVILCAKLRLRVVPHFSSGIVELAKRERAWKSPHARKGDTRRKSPITGKSILYSKAKTGRILGSWHQYLVNVSGLCYSKKIDFQEELINFLRTWLLSIFTLNIKQFLSIVFWNSVTLFLFCFYYFAIALLGAVMIDRIRDKSLIIIIASYCYFKYTVSLRSRRRKG